MIKIIASIFFLTILSSSVFAYTSYDDNIFLPNWITVSVRQAGTIENATNWLGWNGIQMSIANLTDYSEGYSGIDYNNLTRCNTDEILKINGSGDWTCSSDQTGSGYIGINLEGTNVTGTVENCTYADEWSDWQGVSLPKSNVTGYSEGYTTPIANVTGLISSVECNGTDKLTNITIDSNRLYGVCSADLDSGGGFEGIQIPKDNITDYSEGYTAIPKSNVSGSFYEGITLSGGNVTSAVAQATEWTGWTGISSIPEGNLSAPYPYFSGLTAIQKANITGYSEGYSVIDYNNLTKCNANEILKVNGSNQWTCSVDQAGGSGFEGIQLEGYNVTGAVENASIWLNWSGITMSKNNLTDYSEGYSGILKANITDYSEGYSGLIDANISDTLTASIWTGWIGVTISKANVSDFEYFKGIFITKENITDYSEGYTLPIANVTGLISSTQCNGTDKLTNITIDGNRLFGDCASDENSGSFEGVSALQKANITGYSEGYSGIDEANLTTPYPYFEGVSGLEDGNVSDTLTASIWTGWNGITAIEDANVSDTLTASIWTGWNGVTLADASNITGAISAENATNWDGWVGLTIPKGNITDYSEGYSNILKANITDYSEGYSGILKANITDYSEGYSGIDFNNLTKCSADEILKVNGSNEWTCSVDNTGAGDYQGISLPASNVTAGTFDDGDFEFKGNVTLNGSITSNMKTVNVFDPLINFIIDDTYETNDGTLLDFNSNGERLFKIAYNSSGYTIIGGTSTVGSPARYVGMLLTDTWSYAQDTAFNGLNTGLSLVSGYMDGGAGTTGGVWVNSTSGSATKLSVEGNVKATHNMTVLNRTCYVEDCSVYIGYNGTGLIIQG